MTACDFSDQQIDIAEVIAHFDGAISYASDDLAKNWTQGNYAAVLAGKKAAGVVCEQGSQPALRGAAGGTHDAQISNAQANALGHDPTATIFYVAEDPNPVPSADWPTVRAYFEAVAAEGGRPVGGYGGWATLNMLHAAGLIQKGWMVQTWNSGAPNPLPSWIVLMQMVNPPINTYGLPVDVDNVLQADWGQSPRPAPVVQGGQMITPIVSYKSTQIDQFQSSLSTLWHKYSFDGGQTWKNEPIAGSNGGVSGVTLNVSAAQPPTVNIDATKCVLSVEDASGAIHHFTQTVTGPASSSWAHAQLP